MAETIALSAYLDELATMLESESPTEVVSHCRYILQHFPQNVETYRLLARAFLVKADHEGAPAHYTEAAALFQRVLSVLPDDQTAHLGLSEIREQEGAISQAIWHLERAYEKQPGNAALQNALRELYVKRDGADRAPEKIQLTRGALARQYVNGQLFDQALIELRRAIEQAPERLDLQVLLAETLWESQHYVEAGEVAVAILRQLPYSMAANTIMAQLWLQNERPTDAQPFLTRLEALDPYAALRLVKPEVEDSVTLERLDYGARAAATLSSETPDWVQDLGDLDASAMDSVFTTAPSGPRSGPPDGPLDTAAIFGGMGEEPTGEPDWINQLNLGGEAAQPSLDWQSSGAPGTSGAGQDEFDLPDMDWLEQQSAPAASDPIPSPPVSDLFGGSTGEPPGGPQGEMPDWFADVVSEQPPPDTPADAIDWLSPTPEPADTDMDWMSASTPAAPEGSDEVDVFSSFGQTQEQPAEPEADWMAPPAESSGADQMPAAPDWLSTPGDADELDQFPSVDDLAGLPDDMEPAAPDWMAPGEDESAVELVPPLEDLADDLSAEGFTPPAPDWLAEDDAAFATPVSATDETPGDEADIMAEMFARGDEQRDEQPGQDEAASLPVPEFKWDADAPLPEAADQSASGFTDLLQGVDRTPQPTSDFEAQLDSMEPPAPDWVAASFAGDETPEPETEAAAGTLEPLGEEPAAVPQRLDTDWLASFDSDPFEEMDIVATELPSPEDRDEAEPMSPVAEDEYSAAEGDPMAWMQSLDQSAQPPVAGDPEESGAEMSADEMDVLRQASMPPPDFDFDSFFSEEEAGEGSVGAEITPGVPEQPTDLDWMAEPELDFFAPTAQASGEPSPLPETADEDEVELMDTPYSTQAFRDQVVDEDGTTMDEALQAQPADQPPAEWLADVGEMDRQELLDTSPAEGSPEWLRGEQETLPPSDEQIPSDTVEWLTQIGVTGFDKPSAESEELTPVSDEIPLFDETLSSDETPALEAMPADELAKAPTLAGDFASEEPEAESWLDEAAPLEPDLVPAEPTEAPTLIGDFVSDEASEWSESETLLPSDEPLEPAPSAEPVEWLADAGEGETGETLSWLDEAASATPETGLPEQNVVQPAEPAPALADESDQELLDWMQSEIETGDDWLSSFARPADEQAEQAFSITDAPPAEVEPVLPAFDAEPLPAQEAGEDVYQDSRLEAAFDADTFDAYASDDSAAAQTDGDDSETEEPAEQGAESGLLATAQVDDDIPEWMADLEPIEVTSPSPPSPSGDRGTSSLLDEPYDPFEGGTADQVPSAAYQAAGETGILQPDESPAWMTAFTGEELPDEDEEEEVVAHTSELSLDHLLSLEPKPITDSLGDLGLEDWGAEELGEEEEEEPEPVEPEPEDPSVMPDWLVAIASSEADKLDEEAFAELETYSSADETGVLQPGSAPDWLSGVAEGEGAEDVLSAFKLDDTVDLPVPDNLLDEFDLDELDEPTTDEAVSDALAAIEILDSTAPDAADADAGQFLADLSLAGDVEDADADAFFADLDKAEAGDALELPGETSESTDDILAGLGLDTGDMPPDADAFFADLEKAGAAAEADALFAGLDSLPDDDDLAPTADVVPSSADDMFAGLGLDAGDTPPEMDASFAELEQAEPVAEADLGLDWSDLEQPEVASPDATPTFADEDVPSADEMLAGLELGPGETPLAADSLFADLVSDVPEPVPTPAPSEPPMPADLPEVDDLFARPAASEAEPLDLFAEFESERADNDQLAPSTLEMEAAVAQPDDLAHTRDDFSFGDDVPLDSDFGDWDTVGEDEPVPGDFSFDDVTPAWLRKPKESNLPADRMAGYDDADSDSSEKPEWLRDIFEDDDTGR
ncbi:MAG: hypothetical protein GYB65_00720 [Chloroflexi bacterium]|nr:hypothetical protein [Chloroflexota bacterium]